MRIEGSACAPVLCCCCLKGTFIVPSVSNIIVLHTGEQGVLVVVTQQ